MGRHQTPHDPVENCYREMEKGSPSRRCSWPLASERRARFKIADENYANGVRLNDLDDWAGVHEQLAGQPKA